MKIYILIASIVSFTGGSPSTRVPGGSYILNQKYFQYYYFTKKMFSWGDSMILKFHREPLASDSGCEQVLCVIDTV